MGPRLGLKNLLCNSSLPEIARHLLRKLLLNLLVADTHCVCRTLQNPRTKPFSIVCNAKSILKYLPWAQSNKEAITHKIYAVLLTLR